MKGLLLIDIQNDFMPGGSLAVHHGNEIIPLINEIIHYPFDLIVATKDWHSYDHGSFASNHEGKRPGDRINLGGLDQILWPAHCIQGTQGAEFAPGWDSSAVDKVIYKGTDPFIDSYSAFFDNGHRKSTGLEDYFKERGIQQIFIAGLSTDYCVKFSVLDALQIGFQPYVIIDACRGVNLLPGDVERAHFVMREGGSFLLSFKDLKDLMDSEKKEL
jgi:nicotinamidase/pyrazinamidase